MADMSDTTLTVEEKLRLAAQPLSLAAKEAIEAGTRAAMGEVKAEMIAEARRLREEAAKAALEGREADGGGDPQNTYNQNWSAMFSAWAAAQAKPEEKEAKGALGIAKAIVYLAQANGDHRKAFDAVRKDVRSEKELAIVGKALGVDDFSAGGATFQGAFADEVIPELLADSVIAGNPNVPRFELRGQATFPYESSGPTPAWSVENAGVNASESAFEQLVMTEKQVSAISAVSQKFLRVSPAGLEFVLRSLKRRVTDSFDSALIRSTGAAGQIQGLRYRSAAANRLNVNAAVSAQNVVEDLGRLQQALDDANVPWSPGTAFCLLAPRSYRYLFELQDNSSTGFLFRDEMRTFGTVNMISIAGARGRGTTNIPTNLAVTDTSESEIYLVESSALRLGIGDDMRVQISDSASYLNASGTAIPAFSYDQVVAKVVMSADLGEVYRGLATAVLIDVDWA